MGTRKRELMKRKKEGTQHKAGPTKAITAPINYNRQTHKPFKGMKPVKIQEQVETVQIGIDYANPNEPDRSIYSVFIHGEGLIPIAEYDQRETQRQASSPQPTLAIIDESTGIEDITDAQMNSWSDRIIHITPGPIEPAIFHKPI